MRTELERPRPAITSPTHPVPPHRRYRLRLPRIEEADGGLYAGEPETCRRSLARFAPIAVHVGLLVAVTSLYRVEGRAFRILLGLSAAILPIHYLLPYRLKKPFFLASSVAGLAWVFGPAVAVAVLPIAAIMIGICYLPAAWSIRATIIAAIAGVLALARGYGFVGLPPGTWPVLGSIFMFRMIVYLYEQKHAKSREGLLDTVCYFFLLPNYAFLHFPVVDYRTFLRGYFADDIHDIQTSGLRMMVRGTVHLLICRVIYHQFLVAQDEVHGPIGLMSYLACNYLGYLRVSGQFHMACGMLHLFGFRLPETHHNYLLATGFTDYWRRINIYWKDFMVRVVFNPVAFRLKARPQPVALAVATAVVFVVTWALHAYQSFWLRGRWGFSLPDALFWGVLGVLVLVNVQIDARRPRVRTLKGEAGVSARGLFFRIIKTAGTFATIALLWSLWSSPSVGAWLSLLKRGLE